MREGGKHILKTGVCLSNRMYVYLTGEASCGEAVSNQAAIPDPAVKHDFGRASPLPAAVCLSDPLAMREGMWEVCRYSVYERHTDLQS